MKKAAILVLIVTLAAFGFFNHRYAKRIASEEVLIEEGTLVDVDSDGLGEMYGVFAPYNDQTLEMAQGGKIVLFFDAPWCLSCKTFSEDVKMHITEIPADVYILTVDYDSSLGIRNKYGVMQAHTFVLLKSDGGILQRNANLMNLSDLLTQIL